MKYSRLLISQNDSSLLSLLRSISPITMLKPLLYNKQLLSVSWRIYKFPQVLVLTLGPRLSGVQKLDLELSVSRSCFPYHFVDKAMLRQQQKHARSFRHIQGWHPLFGIAKDRPAGTIHGLRQQLTSHLSDSWLWIPAT